MLTTRPHLSVNDPTPTTIAYTVSTVPPQTIPVRLLQGLVNVSRIILGLSIALLLYSKYQLSAFAPVPIIYTSRPDLTSADIVWWSLYQVHTSALGHRFTEGARQLPLQALLPVSFVLFHLLLTAIHTTEDLLVLRGLGIQTTSSPSSYLYSSTTRFIPTTSIQDIVINEVFRGMEVRYMLGVIVQGEEEIVVVFPRLLPGRKEVERVWRGARKCLWGNSPPSPDARGKGKKLEQMDGATGEKKTVEATQSNIQTIGGIRVVMGDRESQLQA